MGICDSAGVFNSAEVDSLNTKWLVGHFPSLPLGNCKDVEWEGDGKEVGRNASSDR